MTGYTGRSSSRSTRICPWLRGASCSALRWNPLSSLNHARMSPELAQRRNVYGRTDGLRFRVRRHGWSFTSMLGHRQPLRQGGLCPRHVWLIATTLAYDFRAENVDALALQLICLTPGTLAKVAKSAALESRIRDGVQNFIRHNNTRCHERWYTLCPLPGPARKRTH